MLPYFANRLLIDIGGVELSHHSTDQQVQRASIPRFRASRKNIDRAEGSNQSDCPPVQYSGYPTEAESTQMEYIYRPERTEGPRWHRQVEPPVQQPQVSTLVPVDARGSGGSARARLSYGETHIRKSTERMVQEWPVQKDILGQDGPRLTRKIESAVQVGQHLHSHDPREAWRCGRRTSTDWRILGSPTDRPRTYTAILRRSKRLRGSGRAGHDSRRICTG